MEETEGESISGPQDVNTDCFKFEHEQRKHVSVGGDKGRAKSPRFCMGQQVAPLADGADEDIARSCECLTSGALYSYPAGC